MNRLGRLHGRFVFGRRVATLARQLAGILPANVTVLDVGCGDGELAHALMTMRPDISVRGVDVLVRDTTRIPVERFDGRQLPAADHSVDVVMMIDVLHHTDDPTELLRESARVARQAVVIKDHLSDPWLAGATLRFMDWVGNSPHGVRLPYNYWTRAQWLKGFEQVGLTVEEWRGHLGLYPWPASMMFERELHFLARLRVGPTA
jgi:SAM-dependent methyltransferase